MLIPPQAHLMVVVVLLMFAHRHHALLLLHQHLPARYVIFKWFHTCTNPHSVCFVKNSPALAPKPSVPTLSTQFPPPPTSVDSSNVGLSSLTEKPVLNPSKSVEKPENLNVTEALATTEPARDSPPLLKSIFPGMKIDSPHQLLHLGQQAHQHGGYKRSEFTRTSKGQPMKSLEMKEYFGFETLTVDGKAIVCPRRGKFTCSYTGCPWNFAWSFKKSERSYVVLDGAGPEEQKYNTNLCLTHSHEPQCTVIEGVTEVTSSKDLTEDEKDFLRYSAVVDSRYVFNCANRTCFII